MTAEPIATIAYLTTVRFGFGALDLLAAELAELGLARPLIVTDAGVIAAGLLERLQAAAPALAAAPVFDATPSNPTEAAVEAAVARYREAGCDGLVALGGGSPIDLAKAVALLATHPGRLAEFALILGGAGRITSAVAPVIAIPTTAGTGAEVGRAALVTLEDGRKLAVLSPRLIPQRAICDPALTLGLPPRLTAATGMDALTHCVETFLSPRPNPVADAIALDGLARIHAALPRAVANGADRAARADCLLAATMGALAFQKGLGAVHALAHPLGGLAPQLHHGALNAVLLPAVLRFSAPAIAPAAHARLAQAMGLEPGADLAAHVERYVAGLGLPTRLSGLGAPLPDAVLAAAADAAPRDHSHATAPRPPSVADYAAILEVVR